MAQVSVPDETKQLIDAARLAGLKPADIIRDALDAALHPAEPQVRIRWSVGVESAQVSVEDYVRDGWQVISVVPEGNQYCLSFIR